MMNRCSSKTLALSLFVLLAGSAGSALCQETEDDTVYILTVQGIQDPVAAKPVQLALMEQPSVRFCLFIPEEPCFKLVTTGAVDYDYVTLRDIVLQTGHQLVGDVFVSGGAVLHPPNEATEEQ